MPVRVALNVAYAMLTADLDEKQRRDFDSRLYGWDKENERANRVLFDQRDDGGGES